MRPRDEQPIGVLILQDLEDGPATIHDLSDVTGLSIRNLRHYLKEMHELRLIHICGWEQREGPALPIWGRDNLPDVIRPKPREKRKGKRMTLEGIKNATRKQLITYLEAWGFQCYPKETTAQLRAAAIENFRVERT